MARKRKASGSDDEMNPNGQPEVEPEQGEQTAFEMGNIVVEGNGEDSDGFSLLEEYSEEIEESGGTAKTAASSLNSEDADDVNLSEKEDFLEDNGRDPEDPD